MLSSDSDSESLAKDAMAFVLLTAAPFCGALFVVTTGLTELDCALRLLVFTEVMVQCEV